MRKLLTASAALVMIAGPAFADGTITDTETANFTMRVAEDCTITNTVASQVVDLASDSTVAINLECNTEFTLAFADDAAGNAPNTVTMTNGNAVESTGDYEESFTGTATDDTATELTAATDNTVAGDFAADNATVTYTIAWAPDDDTGLEAGDYAGSATVTITGTEVGTQPAPAP